MSSTHPGSSLLCASSPSLPTLASLEEVASPAPESDEEAEQDQLTFTIESLSHPQLQLFENVFNTGKPLAGYCQDDLFGLLLAMVTSPCTNCVKSPHNCKVLPNSSCCITVLSRRSAAWVRSSGTGILLISAARTLHIVAGFWSPMELRCITLPKAFLLEPGVSMTPSSTMVLLESNMLNDQDVVTSLPHFCVKEKGRNQMGTLTN
ncbi:hypothetical protein F5051DRAFT_447263 [Lentinula edodes]|nr:hypothetical protein F5051DRAFT_447263 [Lentinula edodes]